MVVVPSLVVPAIIIVLVSTSKDFSVVVRTILLYPDTFFKLGKPCPKQMIWEITMILDVTPNKDVLLTRHPC